LAQGSISGPLIGVAVSSGTAVAAPNREAGAAPVSDGRQHRSRGWSGVVFAVLYVAGLVPLGELLGSFGDPDATFVAFFDKDSNRIGTLVGGLVLALGALSFLWFLSHLRLATIGPGSLPSVVTGAGITFVVLLLIGTASLITVPYARTFGGAYGDSSVLVGSDAVLPQLGYILIAVFGMWAFAALIVAVTVDARRNGTFPRWLVRVGFAAAVFVFLLGSSVMGVLGVPVWALCVAIHWLREARTSRRHDAAIST
jgi:hypothetical protein